MNCSDHNDVLPAGVHASRGQLSDQCQACSNDECPVRVAFAIWQGDPEADAQAEAWWQQFRD